MHARMLILLPRPSSSEAKGDYRSAFFTPNPILETSARGVIYLSCLIYKRNKDMYVVRALQLGDANLIRLA
jgi:hypothetical protein